MKLFFLMAFICYSADFQSRESAPLDQTIEKLRTEQMSSVVTLIKELEDKVPTLYENQSLSLRDHIIIGVGRSPTPFMAYLQVQGYEAYNIPMTKFRYDETDRVRNPTLLPKVIQHFALYLPENMQGRNVIVIDFVFQGGSLIAAHEFLELAYPETVFKMVGFMNRVFPKNFLNGIDLSGHPSLFKSLNEGSFDGHSEFGAFYFFWDVEEKKREPLASYLRIKNMMKEYCLK